MPSVPTPAEDRSTCTPCHGTGKLISNQGGSAHQVTCPWCEGGGRFIPDHNAQSASGDPAP